MMSWIDLVVVVGTVVLLVVGFAVAKLSALRTKLVTKSVGERREVV